MEPRDRRAVRQFNEKLYGKIPSRRLYEGSGLSRYIELSRVKTICRFVRRSRVSSVVEIGCEEGYLLNALPRSVKLKRVFGVDIAAAALRDAFFRFPGLAGRLICGDGISLPFRDGVFEMVVCSETLEHTFEPGEIIKELSRITRQDGWAIISVPNEVLVTRLKKVLGALRLFRLLFPELEEEKSEWHVQEFSPNSFRRLLTRYFRIQKFALVPLWGVGPKMVALCRPMPASK